MRARWILFATLTLAGCRSRPATASDCAALFERIFAMEFKEAGFRDPVLQQRKHDEFARRFAPDLQACAGARLRSGALDCAARAQSVEELSHRCLR
jgi:hypothetical protein